MHNFKVGDRVIRRLGHRKGDACTVIAVNGNLITGRFDVIRDRSEESWKSWPNFWEHILPVDLDGYDMD